MFCRSTLLPFLLTLFAVSDAARTVFYFRHCVRTPGKSISEGDPGFKYPQNYTSHSWPWAGYPHDKCTTRGLQILNTTGQFLANDYSLDGPFKFYSDSESRTVHTAETLLAAMGLTGVTKNNISVPYWHKHDLPNCHCKCNKNALHRARLKQIGYPKNYHALLVELQQILGKGVAPPIYAQPSCVFNRSKVYGGCGAAEKWSANFLLQLGTFGPNSTSFGWGNMTAAQVYKFVELHYWHREVSGMILPIARTGHSNQAAAILEHLDGSPGTTFLVGHDTDQAAIATMFNFTWGAPPYPSFAPTTPGGAFRFDIDDGKIRLQYLYKTFESVESKPKYFPGTFAATGDNKILLQDFISTGWSNLNKACVSK